MQMKAPVAVSHLAKGEDKIAALKLFLQSALAVSHSTEHPVIATMVAKSAESPVARALAECGAEMHARGVTVRAIFMQVDATHSAGDWSISGAPLNFARDLRWAANPRLLDAHEQLVIGGGYCWAGDCMRRDPIRRDAYEQFITADPAAFRILEISFERLWASGTPLVIRDVAGQPGCPEASDAALGAGGLNRDGGAAPMAPSAH